MATANQVCAKILDNVINSGLDFSIHQTPYSIHFSLRKKYCKNSSNKIPLNSPSHDFLLQQGTEAQVEKFRQELLHTRNEYVKLYNMYAAEHEAICKLERENKELIENHATKEQSVENVKAIRAENKSLNEKLENKSLELKHLKTNLENVKKEKNVLSVALKASKAEIKDQRKEFDKKTSELEKKVVELNDFKQIKLSEERELKIKKRKELKKANQKLKKEKEKEENLIKEKLVENEVQKMKVPSESEKDIVEDKPDLNHNFSADLKPELGEDFAHSVDEKIFGDQNLNFTKSEAASISDHERVCHEGVEEDIVVETDEANKTVIKVDVENEDEGSGDGKLISKEDFLEFMAQHREESKADRAKFFQDLRKDLWTYR